MVGISRPIVKHSFMVRRTEDIPEIMKKAFYIASTGRPGPVLIDLPIDVQMGEFEFDPDTYEPLEAFKPAATRRPSGLHARAWNPSACWPPSECGEAR